ncbi:DUF4417 domain-containing protein [Mangrovihabitans endophyticus]|uniref:DUF4417 domain-containing protein n=1 Tax=Mangrovihabitans endophyticus TaxID=1751298 RepID=A0A8J3FRI4_9ACTN|nr:DUF4417 domain-containing protein [Mangrovihabitans endophyticus]GGL16414.1 hypothetical protein GCM10012284_58740 [Mangrovihabitans endophyticus]
MTLAPEHTLGGTRSSHRWAQMPGNWDRLNTRALFPSSNEWGIPDLPATGCEPARLLPYNARHAIAAARPGDAVHFFLDDYRFETVWSKPERGLSRCQTVGTALTPDFSLWTTMPRVMQLWQVYRSRWCGAWLSAHGVTVIPTVSWSTADSYPYAFAGLPAGSTVAVSTVGIVRDRTARELFAAGYTAMLTALHPTLVLVHGTRPTCSVGDVPVRVYPSRWAAR